VVIDQCTEELVHDYTQLLHVDDCIVEDDLEDVVGSVKVPIKTFKKRRQRSYMEKLVLAIKVKFPFELTPRTAINYASIYRYASTLMTEHNLRKIDQARILGLVVELYFIPTDIELAVNSMRNTLTADTQHRALRETTFVDHGVQRYIGLGIRSRVDAPPTNV
jgi:hypothetical protein